LKGIKKDVPSNQDLFMSGSYGSLGDTRGGLLRSQREYEAGILGNEISFSPFGLEKNTPGRGGESSG
jgi:hypothetical protein